MDEPQADASAPQTYLDLHLTALFTWVVQTVGLAIGWSLVVPLVLGFVAVAAGEPAIMFLAAIAGPAVFAWQLMRAQAPMPIDID